MANVSPFNGLDRYKPHHAHAYMRRSGPRTIPQARKGGKATSGNTRQQTQKLTIRHSIVFHLLCDFFHGLFQLSGKGVLAAAVLGFASLALFLFVFS